MDTVKSWPLEGIGAVLTALGSLLTALNAGRIMDWWKARRERRLNEIEARKTARVLLETVELKNEELAMKDRIIERQDREQERMQSVIDRQREHIARLQSGREASR